MKRFNYLNAELKVDGDEPPGYDAPYAQIGPAIDAVRLAGTLAVLEPGQATAPYHWETAHEEWLLVLEGAPHVRGPEGEEQLHAGDMICWPRGPSGAHQVRNRTEERVRLIMFSNRAQINVVVYPDSDKVGFHSPFERGRYRLSDAVDYWHGEGR